MPINLIALKEDFCLEKKAYMAFSPKITDFIIRKAICCFQINIDNAIKHMNVYCCYSWFFDFSQLEIFLDNNTIIIAVFETNILYCYELNICSYYARILNFCYICWTHISRDKEPKFGIFHKMPQLYCQYCLALLKSLTFAEVVVIAKAHHIIRILKLRPNNSLNPRLFRGVCKQFVFLS